MFLSYLYVWRHVLSDSLIRRNLSISQLAIYELPGTSDLSKYKINEITREIA